MCVSHYVFISEPEFNSPIAYGRYSMCHYTHQNNEMTVPFAKSKTRNNFLLRDAINFTLFYPPPPPPQ